MDNKDKPNSGIEHYDLVLANVEDRLLFKGKNMIQWAQELALPEIDESLNEQSLHELNRKAIVLIETVYKNISGAKGFYIASKNSYTKKLSTTKYTILKDIEDHNALAAIKKKVPSNEALENQAFNKCGTEWQAYTISEIFYEFWTLQVQKIQLFNARLTSLNISKHTEAKYSSGF
jgi:hypothetical protein